MSLRSRITILWSLAVVALLALCGTLYLTLGAAREDAAWADRTKDVMLAVHDVLLEVHAAETSQRGYLLTERDIYLAPYGVAEVNVAKAMDRADALIVNDGQKERMSELRKLIHGKFIEMQETINLAESGDFPGARAVVQSDRGITLMRNIREEIAEIDAVQEELLTIRGEIARRKLEQVQHILIIGGPLVAAFLALLGLTTTRRITRPLHSLLIGTRSLSDGQLGHRITERTSGEFGRLAHAFNLMADRQEEHLRERERADRELQQTHTELEMHSRSMELIGKMAQRLQSAISEREFGQVVQHFGPRILSGVPGVLYAHNNSRNLLVPLAYWGQDSTPVQLDPQSCWALRRGQPHAVSLQEPDVACTHVGHGADHREDGTSYVCLPLTAGGDVVGLLHLDGALSSADADAASALVENVALALVNHRLRNSLREQSIRDPLTGLFNRRYMEETLTLEFARAERDGGTIGVIMADIDHFKRFNDTFGHDAGDALLKAVGQVLADLFRQGDIACRYGGEELIVILPGVDLAALQSRAAVLLQAIRNLSVMHKGQSLGNVTMSLGLGVSSLHGQTPSSLIAAADAALYRAKRGGRDRMEVAASPGEVPAEPALPAPV